LAVFYLQSEKLKKINNPATPIDESISLWKSYKKDAEAYLINPARKIDAGSTYNLFGVYNPKTEQIHWKKCDEPSSLHGKYNSEKEAIDWTIKYY
jgi:hypothetical protein